MQQPFAILLRLFLLVCALGCGPRTWAQWPVPLDSLAHHLGATEAVRLTVAPTFFPMRTATLLRQKDRHDAPVVSIQLERIPFAFNPLEPGIPDDYATQDTYVSSWVGQADSLLWRVAEIARENARRPPPVLNGLFLDGTGVSIETWSPKRGLARYEESVPGEGSPGDLVFDLLDLAESYVEQAVRWDEETFEFAPSPPLWTALLPDEVTIGRKYAQAHPADSTQAREALALFLEAAAHRAATYTRPAWLAPLSEADSLSFAYLGARLHSFDVPPLDLERVAVLLGAAQPCAHHSLYGHAWDWIDDTTSAVYTDLLRRAAEAGCGDRLPGAPRDVDARDFHSGETALHSAAGQPSVDWVRQLLDQGANPNARDRDGNTPLHEAALVWSKKAAARDSIEALLYNAGANPALENYYGQTAAEVGAERQVRERQAAQMDSLMQRRDAGFTPCPWR